MLIKFSINFTDFFHMLLSSVTEKGLLKISTVIMYNIIYFSYGSVKFCIIYFANMLFVIVELLSRDCQASLSMGFPRQESWSRLLFLFPRDLPNPGIKPVSPALSGGFLTAEPPGEGS